MSIVIPVFNEAKTIGEVLHRLHNAQLELDRQVIVVDDGSTDATVAEIEKCAHLVDIVHQCKVNGGKGVAVRIGLGYATGDIVLLQDGDLELDPAEIPRLLEPIVRGQARVVYGSRFQNHVSGLPRASLLANRFLTLLTNILYGSSLTDMETAYKAAQRDVLAEIELHSRGFEIEPELTAKILRRGHSIVEVPIGYTPRDRLNGKKIGVRDGVLAVWTLVRCRMARDGTGAED